MTLPGAGPYLDAPPATSRPPAPFGGSRDLHDAPPPTRRPADPPRDVSPAAPTPAPVGSAVALDGSAPSSRAALHDACLTLTAMASALGLPRATLAAYRLGTRRPPAAVRARLAAYLAARADALRAHAAALAAGEREAAAVAVGPGPLGGGTPAGPRAGDGAPTWSPGGAVFVPAPPTTAPAPGV